MLLRYPSVYRINAVPVLRNKTDGPITYVKLKNVVQSDWQSSAQMRVVCTLQLGCGIIALLQSTNSAREQQKLHKATLTLVVRQGIVRHLVSQLGRQSILSSSLYVSDAITCSFFPGWAIFRVIFKLCEGKVCLLLEWVDCFVFTTYFITKTISCVYQDVL